MHDIIIIGGGPAGLTAAIYARRAGKSVLVLEKNGFGGQIAWSPRVENFPGYTAISGVELGDKLLEQAMEQGADAELEEVVSVEDENGVKTLRTASGLSYQARAVIVAAGAKPRPLGVPGEEPFQGSGVCYCAVCDGAFYKNQAVAVAGGGNSALQDALFLSSICAKVTLIHRRDSFRGEQRLVEALKAKDNVEFILGAEITGLSGGEELTGVVLRHGGETRTVPVSGLFVAVGHQPDLEPFAQLMELDKRGYAASGEDCRTKTAGVFVAGDCRSKMVRQLTTAASDGACAALAACEFLG